MIELMEKNKYTPAQYVNQFIFKDVTECNLKLDAEMIAELQTLRCEEVSTILERNQWVGFKQFEIWLREQVTFQVNHSKLRRTITVRMKEILLTAYNQYFKSIFWQPDGDEIRAFSTFCNERFVTVIVSETSRLLMYNREKGIYEDTAVILHQVILVLLENFSLSKWTNSMLKEIINRIQAKSIVISERLLNIRGVAFRNFTLDLECNTPKFKEHSPDFYLTRSSDVVVDDKASSPRFLQFIEEILPHEKDFIQEWGGYLLESTNRAQKFLIASGSGRNGKSVLFDIISKVLDHKNVSALSMSSLSSRFGREPLLGKFANISNEGASFDYSPDIIKSLTSDEPISIDRKNKAEITVVPTAKLVFITNTLPPIRDASFGYERRLLLLEFSKTISENQVDPYLTEKLSTELSGILNFFVAGLQRLRENTYVFSESDRMKEDKRIYFLQDNPMETFIEEHFEQSFGNRSYRKEIFEYYSSWLIENNKTDKVATNAQQFWGLFTSEFIKVFGAPPTFKKNAKGRFLEGFSFNIRRGKNYE